MSTFDRDPAIQNPVAHAPGDGAAIQHAQTQEHTARVSPSVGSQSNAGLGPNVARNGGRPKSSEPVLVHGAMTRHQAALKGMGHAVSPSEIPDASSGNPLDPMPASKAFVGKTVPTVPGQRSRTHNSEVGPTAVGEAHATAQHADDSDAILNGAVRSGSTVIGGRK